MCIIIELMYIYTIYIFSMQAKEEINFQVDLLRLEVVTMLII